MWLKIKQEGLRRFWSTFPLTRVPFWYRFLEPQPSSGFFIKPQEVKLLAGEQKATEKCMRGQVRVKIGRTSGSTQTTRSNSAWRAAGSPRMKVTGAHRNFQLLKICVLFPCWFKGNLSLLEIFSFFPGGLSKWQKRNQTCQSHGRFPYFRFAKYGFFSHTRGRFS